MSRYEQALAVMREANSATLGPTAAETFARDDLLELAADLLSDCGPAFAADVWSLRLWVSIPVYDKNDTRTTASHRYNAEANAHLRAEYSVWCASTQGFFRCRSVDAPTVLGDAVLFSALDA